MHVRNDERLEGFSGELACRRVTDAEIQQIRALHFEMLACHARRDSPGYYRLNHAIHDAINAAARNPVLTQTYLQINARLQALRFRSNFEQDKWDPDMIAARQKIFGIENVDAKTGPTFRRDYELTRVSDCEWRMQ